MSEDLDSQQIPEELDVDDYDPACLDFLANWIVKLSLIHSVAATRNFTLRMANAQRVIVRGIIRIRV